MENVVLINTESMQELGNRLYEILNKKINIELIEPQEIRFSNGEAKIIIKEQLRNKRVFILIDVGNYSCKYKIHNNINSMSPDDHYMNVKRIISAIKGNCKNITIIMPLLYASRQHRCSVGESLDCSMALQDLTSIGVDSIITIDVHDPGIQNSIPYNTFENYQPTSLILTSFLRKIDYDPEKIIVISPDTGAVNRTRHFADLLKCDLGMFYKRRDLSKVIHGKNPIVAHEYMGADVKNKTALIVDDIIASGSSVMEVVEELNKKGCSDIYIAATFGLFNDGIEKFNQAYHNNMIKKIYITNATYVSPKIANKEWIEVVDIVKLLEEAIMNSINM